MFHNDFDDVHDDTKGSFSINFALCLLNVLLQYLATNIKLNKKETKTKNSNLLST